MVRHTFYEAITSFESNIRVQNIFYEAINGSASHVEVQYICYGTPGSFVKFYKVLRKFYETMYSFRSNLMVSIHFTKPVMIS